MSMAIIAFIAARPALAVVDETSQPGSAGLELTRMAEPTRA
jgi:hypothetical protein